MYTKDEKVNTKQATSDSNGDDLYSVETDDDIGNWMDSFRTRAEAEHFINARLMNHDPATDFRDTRYARVDRPSR